MADPGPFDARADLTHIRMLAAERGVPVEEVDGDLPYACVGLIKPRGAGS